MEHSPQQFILGGLARCGKAKLADSTTISPITPARFSSFKRFPSILLRKVSHVSLFRFFCTSHGRVNCLVNISQGIRYPSRPSWFRSSRYFCRPSPRLSPVPSTMIDSWSAICRQCVSTVVEVPASILLGSILATAIGVFALVSYSATPGSPVILG